MKVLVLTISDRASKGIYEDLSGPAIKEIFEEKLNDADILVKVVPDEKDAILKSFEEHSDKDIIITTGGTGISPRDITPDVTEEYCDRLLPGVSDYLRRESEKETINAIWSRQSAGVKDKTIIINVPGSLKGAKFCSNLLAPTLEHSIRMLKGEGH